MYKITIDPPMIEISHDFLYKFVMIINSYLHFHFSHLNLKKTYKNKQCLQNIMFSSIIF